MVPPSASGITRRSGDIQGGVVVGVVTEAGGGAISGDTKSVPPQKYIDIGGSTALIIIAGSPTGGIEVVGADALRTLRYAPATIYGDWILITTLSIQRFIGIVEQEQRSDGGEGNDSWIHGSIVLVIG